MSLPIVWHMCMFVLHVIQIRPAFFNICWYFLFPFNCIFVLVYVLNVHLLSVLIPLQPIRFHLVPSCDIRFYYHSPHSSHQADLHFFHSDRYICEQVNFGQVLKIFIEVIHRTQFEPIIIPS